jgi:hypothetical protein
MTGVRSLNRTAGLHGIAGGGEEKEKRPEGRLKQQLSPKGGEKAKVVLPPRKQDTRLIQKREILLKRVTYFLKAPCSG